MNISIVETVKSVGVELRARGRVLVGLCPFHTDRHPSLVVNAEKNVWYCHPCNLGGNAVEFIKKLHGVGVREAFEILGRAGPPKKPDRVKTEMALAYEWAQKTLKRLNWIVYNIGKKIHTLGITEDDFDNALVREWVILCDLDEDLNAHKFVEFPETEWAERGKSGTWEKDTERITLAYRLVGKLQKLRDEGNKKGFSTAVTLPAVCEHIQVEHEA